MTPADSERLAALIATERATRAPGAGDPTRVIDATEPSETRLSAPDGSGQASRTRTAEDRPPTGPGSPAVASKRVTRRDDTGETGGNVTPITQRGMGRPPRLDKRTAARANARGGQRGAAEARIRAALAREPDLAFDDLVKVAGVSPSSASKWLAVIQTERAAAQRAR